MAALITVSNSEGIVGRCDAKCHDAGLPKCDCICGGMNHGVGVDQAVRNTVEFVLGDREPERKLREFAEKHALEADDLQIDPIQTGLDL